MITYLKTKADISCASAVRPVCGQFQTLILERPTAVLSAHRTLVIERPSATTEQPLRCSCAAAWSPSLKVGNGPEATVSPLRSTIRHAALPHVRFEPKLPTALHLELARAARILTLQTALNGPSYHSHRRSEVACLRLFMLQFFPIAETVYKVKKM